MLKHLDKAHFGNPSKVEIGADGDTRYRGEADDLDNPSSALSPIDTPFHRRSRHRSSWDLNITLVYLGFDLSAAASLCTIQVPHRVISSIDFFSVAAITLAV